MIKFLRILTQKILLVIIFLCLSFNFSIAYAAEAKKEPLTLEEALKVYSTPFIDDYRARYEFDNYTKPLATLSAHKTCSDSGQLIPAKIYCTKKDIDSIKELAKYGDNASLALAVSFIKDKKLLKTYYKKAADNGSIEGLISYGEMLVHDDFALGKSYLEQAKANGGVEVYIALLRLYSTYKMVDEFCTTMDEGHRNFGFEFIAPHLLHYQTELSRISSREPNLFAKYPQICLKKTSEQIYNDVNNDLARLYKGYQYVFDKKYRKAKNLFEEIYAKTNNIDLKQNAGFCLGAMYYSGTAVKKNAKYGIKLIKEALEAGYETYIHVPELNAMPKDSRILKYKGSCDYIFLRETDERIIK